GNGDLTEPDERVAAAGTWFRVPGVTEADGATPHTALRLRRMGNGDPRLTPLVRGKHHQFVGFCEGDPLRLAPRPPGPPAVHLGGPLTVRLYGEPPVFRPGKTAALNVAVGTPGLGEGSFAAIQTCELLAEKTAPVAEIEFPHRVPGQPPIRARVSVGED